ncbi:MAG: hypothetical protein J6V25_11760 [Oscillospiraceae bacterium]|nr:hypothetical protein [Oscillospiraceae bacterium]
MKVFIVTYESEAGILWETLLIVRKVYGQPQMAVKRWDEAHGLSDVAVYNTENCYRAMELFMATHDDEYDKMLSAEEVTFQ